MIDPATDEEEAGPRFLLTGPVRVDAVGAVLGQLRPAAWLVGAGWSRRLLDVAHGHDVALLIEDDIDPEADGAHLTDPKRVPQFRAEVDRSPENPLILGAEIGLSRHDAMVAGEEGADYVAFGDPARSAEQAVFELVAWWRSVTILPCLAYAQDVETVTRLARIGTDFIGVSEAIWAHPEGPVAGARELTAALEKS